ncbi:hypothetical protein [Caldisericum sp.]|uniref:hypothetical protein n=1 Tax=Caldisericum sp. TaxID=2499687 RepID=UPI003D14783E
MVDKLYLKPWEEAKVDTSSNTVTVLVMSGNVVITNTDYSLVFAELTEKEMFTLPIQTGLYVLKNQDVPSEVYLFRMFIY